MQKGQKAVSLRFFCEKMFVFMSFFVGATEREVVLIQSRSNKKKIACLSEIFFSCLILNNLSFIRNVQV